MTTIQLEQLVYIVLGIDEAGCDQVLAVHASYEGAKRYCIHALVQTGFYDVWIEKHRVL